MVDRITFHNDLSTLLRNGFAGREILQGARQVGKTWVLKHFGRECYEHTAYFNFEEQPELKQFFETTKDPARILQNLTLVNAKPIKPGSSLIIFDEIQECNNALNSLKYFCENSPEYDIACAGSLLGVTMSRGSSFPVGKVDFLTLHPLTFNEFIAASDPGLFSYMESVRPNDTVPDIFFNPLSEKLKLYFITGGMPEAVAAMLETRDLELTQAKLSAVLNAYALDFSKHASNKDVQKIGYIWSSLPSQLSRENRKFLYQAVKPGARAREYEDALLWLINAGLALRVYCSSKPSLPVSAYDDLTAFKIYMPDVGLLRRSARLSPSAVYEGSRLLTEFKGALTENFILQSLVAQFESLPRYWRSGNKAEVDFLLQYKDQIIPVEVKSDENTRSRSLTLYRQTFNPEISIRYSMKNLKLDDGLLNIPLFMACYTQKFLDAR